MVQTQVRGPGQPDQFQRLHMLGLVIVLLALLKLTISGAGWEIDGLTWVQTTVFVFVAILMWSGGLRRSAVTYPLLGMVLAIGVTAIWSIRPEASVRALALWIMYGGIFAVVAALVTSGRAAHQVLDGALAIECWVCLVAVAWASNATLLGSRWYSTFYWPNPFAAFLLLLIPVALTRLMWGRSRSENFAHGLISLVLLVAFALTYSRGAWLILGGVAVLGVVVLRPPARGVALQRVLIVVLLAALASVLVAGRSDNPRGPGSLVERVVSITDGGDESVRGRVSFWRSAIAIFRDHPWVGTGPWTYGIAHTRYQDDVRFYASDAHNVYLQTAAEMGMVGVVSLAVLVIAIAALWIRTLVITQGSPDYPIIAGVGLGLAGFFLHSALDVNWAFPANPAMAFALVGVLAGYEASSRRAPSALTIPVELRVALTAILVVAIAVVHAGRIAQHSYADGQRFLSVGKWDRAVVLLGEATRLNPLHPDYVVAAAIARSRTAGPTNDLVSTALHRAMALDRMNATYRAQEAIRLMGQGVADPSRARAAEELLRQALVLDRFNDPTVYRVLAQLYRMQGRTEDAAGVYRTARGIYLGHGLGRGSLIYQAQWRKVLDLVLEDADLLIRRGNNAEAVDVLRAALRDDPGAIPVALRLSTLYAALGRTADARGVLAVTAVRVPDSLEIRAALDAFR